MTDAVTLFGIRHHGPGCARSLRRALETLQPDCVLIEGPAGSEPLLAHLADAGADNTDAHFVCCHESTRSPRKIDGENSPLAFCIVASGSNMCH